MAYDAHRSYSALDAVEVKGEFSSVVGQWFRHLLVTSQVVLTGPPVT